MIHPRSRSSGNWSLRVAVESDPAVADATKTYQEKWTQANEAIRTRMLTYPASKSFVREIQSTQLLQDTRWFLGGQNDPAILWPHVAYDWKDDSVGIMVLANNRSPQARFPSDAKPPAYPQTLADIRGAVLASDPIKPLVQAVGDAYHAMDLAARAALKSNPDTKTLVEKYDYLLYGRVDLGFFDYSMVGDVISPGPGADEVANAMDRLGLKH